MAVVPEVGLVICEPSKLLVGHCASVVAAPVVVEVVDEISTAVSDTRPISEDSSLVSVVSANATGILSGDAGAELGAVASVAELEACFLLKLWSKGYSNGRFDMGPPASEVIGIEHAELDHVPELTLWKAIRCSCSVSVEAHSRQE